MGEPTFQCCRAPDGCCLELHETVIILVALIVLVQLALKVASVICYYLLHLFMSACRAVFAKEKVKVKVVPQRGKKRYSRKPAVQWSDQEVPHRQRRESNSPRRRCLHCTLEPLKVTMNVHSNNEDLLCTEHQHVGRLPYPNQPAHYHTCECEARNRPRTSSAPSAYITTRYRDAAVGNSDPMMSIYHGERRNAIAGGFEPFPRSQVAELPYHPHGMGHAPEVEHPGYSQRSRRPTKVYIYPVHPQTPPGSRTASPDRGFRRRGTVSPEDQLEHENREQRRRRGTISPEDQLEYENREQRRRRGTISPEDQLEYENRERRRRGTVNPEDQLEHENREQRRRRGTLNPEDQLEYENREQRRKSRDIEQEAMAMPRFHSIGTSVFPGPGAQMEGPSKKQSYVWPEEPPGSDWVYRPLK